MSHPIKSFLQLLYQNSLIIGLFTSLGLTIYNMSASPTWQEAVMLVGVTLFLIFSAFTYSNRMTLSQLHMQSNLSTYVFFTAAALASIAVALYSPNILYGFISAICIWIVTSLVGAIYTVRTVINNFPAYLAAIEAVQDSKRRVIQFTKIAWLVRYTPDITLQRNINTLSELINKSWLNLDASLKDAVGKAITLGVWLGFQQAGNQPLSHTLKQLNYVELDQWLEANRSSLRHRLPVNILEMSEAMAFTVLENLKRSKTIDPDHNTDRLHHQLTNMVLVGYHLSTDISAAQTKII